MPNKWHRGFPEAAHAGATYYISARNWELAPTPSNSCPMATCNAIMNVQAAVS